MRDVKKTAMRDVKKEKRRAGTPAAGCSLNRFGEETVQGLAHSARPGDQFTEQAFDFFPEADVVEVYAKEHRVAEDGPEHAVRRSGFAELSARHLRREFFQHGIRAELHRIPFVVHAH